MKSASNGDVLNSSLQVLHVHVLLGSPLGTSHIVQTSFGAELPSGKLPTTRGGGFPGSIFQWYYLHGYEASIHWGDHSRSKFPH